MRNRDDPEVLEHLDRENAYTDSILSKHRDLEETLYHELVSRIEETNESAPYLDGGHEYKSRIEKGADYRQYYRREAATEGAWQLFFDAAEEAVNQDYFDLAFLDISPDGKLLAYATDLDGDEIYSIHFRDLQTGRQLPWMIEAVSGDGEWDAASRSYFVIKEDDTKRPFQIWRYQPGQPIESMNCLYEEADPRFYLDLSKSQDGDYLFATSSSKETTEVRYLHAHSADGAFQVIIPRREGIQYFAEHHSGQWLIRSNDSAEDFKLLACAVGAGNPDEHAILMPAREHIRLEDVVPFRHHLVLMEREAGLTSIRIRNLMTNEDHLVEMPEQVYEADMGINAEFDTTQLTYVYSSPIRPQQVIRYDMDRRTRHILKTVKVPSGHNPDDYRVYRMQVPSHDGGNVPVTIVHPTDYPMDGSGKMYLYGYGAYGITIGARFRNSLLSFLERGYCVAVAHVRGSGLLGESWYQAGKLMNKKNSFLDFIAVANELIHRRYTQPAHFAIEGGSAGGLLIGAVLNLCPQLFTVAVAEVPFVDVLNTMLDETLPITIHEYEEWGNPKEKAAFDYIRSYCPYENTGNLPYPAILAMAGYNDPRVAYWEPAKWIARLRSQTTASHPLLLKTYFESGHAGATGRYQQLREIAFTQAFIIFRLQDSAEED